MKKYIAGLGLLTLGFLPQASHALSCIDPEGMINHIVENPDYIVVTATPTEQIEYVSDEAVADDPNKQYNSGLTGQFLTVSEVHKGTSPSEQWAYFERNGTWNYLCVGNPPTLESEQVYVLSAPTSVFEPQRVVAVYEAGSDMAADLLEAVSDEEEVVEPMLYESSADDWATRFYDELKALAFIVKVKLAEWQFWSAR